MTSRSNSVWNESPIERVLMKLYRVPDTVTVVEDRVFRKRKPIPSPQDVRDAARDALQREQQVRRTY